MKKITSFLIALVLVFGILFIAVADVNHGHGPDHATEENNAESPDAGGH